MYTWNPVDYHQNSSEQARWAREILDRQKFRGDERVLDLGSGDGKITAEIAARVPRGFVDGVDLSDRMVAFAREHFPAASYPNLRFYQAGAESFASLFEGGEKFDFVFSNACLHWVRDQATVLAGVRACLRPGGRFYFQMGGRGNVAELTGAVAATAAGDRWKVYFENFAQPYFFYGPEEYGVWLTESGLQAERLELVPKDNFQPGVAGVAAYLRTTWMPYTSYVPEAEREDFINEAAARFVAAYPPVNGRVNIPMTRLEVVGHG